MDSVFGGLSAWRRRAAAASRVPRLAARAWSILCIAATLLLTACGTDTCQLDRTGAPVRFADLRETAAWTPGFDPAWWGPIDRAYAQYDADVERVVRTSWDPFVDALRDAEQTGFPKESRPARAMWATHVRVRRELSDAEQALCAAIAEALPPEADPFVDLLRARAAFWRAGAVWAEHGKRLPGPLEVLALTGPSVADADVARAATEAYARLAAVATRAAEERFDAYIEYCEEIGPAERERAALEVALPPKGGAGDAPDVARAREAAEQRLAAATQRMEQIGRRLNDVARREADEKFRVALLRENRAFADALVEPERQLDFLDRVDAFLHIGVRSHQSLRAMRDVALRVAERKSEDAETSRERIRKAFDDYFAAEKPLRARLAGGSIGDRKDAYGRLVQLVGPLYEAIAQATGVRGEVLDLASIGVSAGRDSAFDAAEAALQPETKGIEPPQAPVNDDALISARSREMSLLSGVALSPRVIGALSAELSLGAAPGEEIARLRGEEIARLAEHSGRTVAEMRRRTEEIARDASMDAASRARAIVREGRRMTDGMRALDVAANARMLSAIAGVAGVGMEDPRIARAALELELLSRVGASERSNFGEGIGGAVADGIASPFEIIRTMRVEPEDRDAALAIAFGFADELRAAHAEMSERMFRNLEEMLSRAFEQQAEKSPPEDAWHSTSGGRRAVEVRLAIAAELARVLGPDVGRAYHERWRESSQPGMTAPRAAPIAPLERFASGVRMNPAEREATGSLRAEVDAVLLAAGDAREAALRALHAWRTGETGLGDVDGPSEWDGIARFTALGAFLRNRVRDVDDRAIARCEALLAADPGARGSPAAAEALAAIRRPPLELPVRLSPYFPEQ